MSENKIYTWMREIGSKFVRARQSIESYRQSTLRVIESYYDEAIDSNQFPILKTLTVSWYIFVFNIIAIESFFLFVIIFTVLLSSGLINFLDFSNPLIIVLYWMTITLLALVIIFCVTIVTVTLHLRYGISALKCAFASALISSILLSLAIPPVTDTVFDSLSYGTAQLFFPVLSILIFAQILMFITYEKVLCFTSYKQRMQKNTLDMCLPKASRGKILVLSAQDHYVEIKTENGSHLARISLSEAVRRLPDNQGALVHRSHWVANDIAKELIEIDGKWLLTLKDGQQIRVSSTKLPIVRKMLENQAKL